jgi:hypothetical protein|tara:strand:+ start:23 stop:472 length:450 start_codon:yes stop_codon:yes gene_type:complete
MSLVKNINNRKKDGTSRSAKKSTISDKAYAEMQAGYRDGGMVDQMSEQMGVSNKEAGGLMKKAKKMNDSYSMNMGGMMAPPMETARRPGMGGFEMNRDMGGSVMILSLGKMPSMRHHREEREEDSSLIQSTENQVRARHFNNNGGKGTF